MSATSTVKTHGFRGRLRALVFVAVAASSLATVGVGIAGAESEIGLTMSCTGTVSPGLNATPSSEGWAASCSGAKTCNLSGTSTIAETLLHGSGILRWTCTDGSGSGTYDRSGPTMALSGTGFGPWVCLFQADQTPPATVTSFHLLCA